MRVALRLPLIAAAVALSTCGGDSPPAATPITTTTTTMPPPSTTPPAKSCTLPPMPDCGGRAGDCCRERRGPLLFEAEIRAAQEAVRQARPEWFRANGSIRVSDPEYTEGVAQKVTELFGLCARGGSRFHREHSISPDEVAIKRDNSLSQNTDIIIGASQQPQVGKYSTCQPASF